MADENFVRGSRAEEERTQRRRRGGENLEATRRLPIPPEIKAQLEAQGLVPRWVNDTDNRMHRFTVMDDYDKVEGVPPVPVGTDAAGAPVLAHLLAKRADFIEADRREADAKRSELEKALFRKANAADAAGASANPNPATAERYVDTASKIGRGNQIIE